jgi:hypothetical protein
MANKIVKTFEEFVSFEIENSEVHIHLGSEETEELMEPTTKAGDEVIIDVPLMNLSSKGHSEYEEDMDSEEDEDETPESDEDEKEDDE